MRVSVGSEVDFVVVQRVLVGLCVTVVKEVEVWVEQGRVVVEEDRVCV